jgi:AcrR family transcriptional regulator
MVFVSSDPLPTPPWSSARAPQQRRTLNRDLIVDTAMAIVDEEGLDGLSMRRLADRLGTGPASLYAHVSGRDELLMLLIERAAADIVIPEPEPERWAEQVREVAYSMRNALLPHRDLAGAALANIPTGEHAMRFADRLLAVLLAGGVNRRHAVMVIDLLPQLVVNDVYEGSLFARRLERQPDYFEQLQNYWSSMPADRFPHVAAMAEEISGTGEDEGELRFAFALELFVTGLAAVTTTGRP